MIRINLRRMSECSLCDRPTPVLGNARGYLDEGATAQLCQHCETVSRAHAELKREVRKYLEDQR
jgi:hypothetical protein